MRRQPAGRLLAVVAALIVATAAAAETWHFDLTTTGNDVIWVSPTPVDNTAREYLGEYEIELVEVTGTWQGFPVGPIDVTNEIPGKVLASSEVIDGPPPIVLLDESIVYPEPPEPPSVAAHLWIFLSAPGIGNLHVTDVTLGTVTVDLGFPFGVQTIQLTSIRVAGTIEFTPIVAPCVDADLNCDGVVDVFDLLALLSAWGDCPAPCLADLNGDGVVDVFDLLILLASWG